MSSEAKTCFLFTYSYPFEYSEPFLETEIKYLSKVFSRIYIFSIGMNSNNKMTRELPNNVVAFPLNCSQNKIKNITKGLMNYKKNHITLQKNLLKRFADLYATGRFYSAFKNFVSIVEINNIPLDNSVFYSYWLNSSFIFFFLKTYLTNKNVHNVKYVSRAHGFDLFQERNRLNYLPFQKVCIETLDCVCPISIDGVNYLNNNYSQLSKKVHLFRLGTEDYGIKTNPQNLKNIEIASCSSLYPNKRVSLIASSISKLTNRYNILWHCIGDGKEYKKIKSIIKKNKIQKNVILYGRLSNKKVIDVYKKNNIRFFINVSKHEGVPVSIMEAMSFGIPCVATNVGGTSEIVDDSCGFLLNSTIDSNELSNTIEKVINLSNTEYCLLREQTRCKWLENSSAKKNYSIWGSFLTK